MPLKELRATPSIPNDVSIITIFIARILSLILPKIGLYVIDAVTWLHLFLLIGAISFNVVAVVHWIMMEMLRHGFKQ